MLQSNGHPLTYTHTPRHRNRPYLIQEAETEGQDDGRARDDLGPHADLRAGEAQGPVVGEMADAVEEVVDEGPGEHALDGALDEEGHGGEGGDEGGRLDVPAQQRGDQVQARVGVERAGEGAARYAGPDRGAEPGLLGPVDLQVGGERAVEALGGQEGVFVRGGELLGRDGAAGWFAG